jgi:DNA-binding MurR/RpiR family transcriptional regulator
MNGQLRDLLTRPDLALTPSEARIVQVLLSDYPISGLGTATSLARKAGVSDPTVARLVVKLGFDGFPDFQACLLADVEARLHSPLLMMEAKRSDAGSEGAAHSYLGSVARNVEKTGIIQPVQNYDRAVKLLWETKGQVVLLGGRFSRHLAAMLAGYLHQFRPRTMDVGALAPEKFDLLVDLNRRDVLVVFDYRRYQCDVVAFARQAADRGVRILLFTDTWQSPIAEIAEVTLSSPTEAKSPYDTLAPAMAQLEAVVAHAIAAFGDGRNRIEAIEHIRRANAVTLDEPGAVPSARARNADGNGATGRGRSGPNEIH